MSGLGVLDIGGTHVTAAHVDADTWQLSRSAHRVDLDAQAGAEVILDAIASAAAGAHEQAWAVAMPDPFDYVRGIGRFHDVGKFEALDGVDVRAGLAHRLGLEPGRLSFCNDADAFTVGEWLVGAGRGAERVVGLTFGTGVGSGWIDGGRVVDPGVPDGGRAHRLTIDGRPLEDVMSRRAIRRGYTAAGGDPAADVREIAQRARDGEQRAADVLARALRGAGRVLAGPIAAFGADLVVVGGSMAQSWPLLGPWFADGAGERGLPPVRVAADSATAPLVGAGYVALSAT